MFTDLDVPWGLAFAPAGTPGFPQGSAVLGHRNSYELSLLNGTTRRTIGSIGSPSDQIGEGGLLGLAFHPETRDLLAYLTTGTDNRLLRVRLRANGDSPTVDGVDVVLDGIPKNTIHDGGGVAVGPDGMLYVSTGDIGNGAAAQDLSSYAGKILRLTPDGKVPSDNPFPGSYVYSFGHRNVQGLAFDDDGRLWASEFGQNTRDEINRIRAGGNYGWPAFEGNDPYGDPLPAGADPIRPAATFSTADASPSGLAYADGALYLAALRGQRLLRIAVRGNELGEVTTAADGYGRVRGVAAVPGRDVLWFWTNNTDGRGEPRQGDDRIVALRAPAPE